LQQKLESKELRQGIQPSGSEERRSDDHKGESKVYLKEHLLICKRHAKLHIINIL
jgi:hypothetical protein